MSTPGLINHGLGRYSRNSHELRYFFMVPSQLNSRLGSINPGLTLPQTKDFIGLKDQNQEILYHMWTSCDLI